MSTHTAEQFDDDDHNEQHAENVGAPDEDREVSISDEQLPDDLQPSEDNPLAQDPDPDAGNGPTG